MEEILHAKIVMAITNGGSIGQYVTSLNSSLYQNDIDKIDLLNLVFVAHCNQYKKCTTQDERNVRIDLMLNDIMLLESILGKDYVSRDLFKYLLKLSEMRPVNSVGLREAIIGIMHATSETQSICIKMFICRNLVNYIIRVGLYGSQPYDDVLAQCVTWMENNTIENLSSLNILWWRSIMQ